MTREEARDELAVQDEASELDRKLDSKLGGDYAGLWFAPESDEAIKVAVEAPRRRMSRSSWNFATAVPV